MAKVKKSASAKKAKKSISLNQEVWPLEKDVLFRPDRLKYVRKLVSTDGCVFCSASGKKASFDSLCLYKSKTSMVVLNKYPYNSGHLLILPLVHKGDLLELTDAEFSDLHALLKLSMKALNQTYRPEGINIGLNHGKVAGAGIPEHLHYHMIPRWAGDVNFFPLIAETKVVVENLEQSYERLMNFFERQKS